MPDARDSRLVRRCGAVRMVVRVPMNMTVVVPMLMRVVDGVRRGGHG
jgi:hypothetical protein